MKIDRCAVRLTVRDFARDAVSIIKMIPGAIIGTVWFAVTAVLVIAGVLLLGALIMAIIFILSLVANHFGVTQSITNAFGGDPAFAALALTTIIVAIPLGLLYTYNEITDRYNANVKKCEDKRKA